MRPRTNLAKQPRTARPCSSRPSRYPRSVSLQGEIPLHTSIYDVPRAPSSSLSTALSIAPTLLGPASPPTRFEWYRSPRQMPQSSRRTPSHPIPIVPRFMSKWVIQLRGFPAVAQAIAISEFDADDTNLAPNPLCSLAASKTVVYLLCNAHCRNRGCRSRYDRSSWLVLR